MKPIVTLLLLFIVVSNAQAQVNYTQTLKGSIVDKELKYTLSGATVKVFKDTLLISGSKTNERGDFNI